MTATKTGQRPSELIGVEDEWAAYQFDSAVVLVGTAIEGAAQEMEKRGSDDNPRWEPKYTMKQLLDEDFRLPLAEDEGDFDELVGAHGIIFDEVQ